MRWTLKVVNPRALAWGKTTSEWLTTWYSPHMKTIIVLLYRNYSKMSKTWMFCFVSSTPRLSGIQTLLFSNSFILWILLYVGNIKRLAKTSILVKNNFFFKLEQIYIFISLHCIENYRHLPKEMRGCRGRMVVGFTSTYEISAYHH
jgi:hypothetical protein